MTLQNSPESSTDFFLTVSCESLLKVSELPIAAVYQAVIKPESELYGRSVLSLQFALKQQCLNNVTWADRPPQGLAELSVDLCSSEGDKFITNKVVVSANSLYDLISTFNVILFGTNGYRCPHCGIVPSGKYTL